MAEEKEQHTDFHDPAERPLDWLAQQWGKERACLYCGEKSWGVSPTPRRFLTEGDGVDPMYTATCRGCGYTALIDSRFVPDETA